MGRTTPLPEDDYEVEEQKQAAADVLNNYSQFALVCIGEEVRPCDLRLHLMKEISGMRSTLKKNPPSTAAASPNSTGKASSSGTTKEDMAESS